MARVQLARAGLGVLMLGAVALPGVTSLHSGQAPQVVAEPSVQFTAAGDFSSSTAARAVLDQIATPGSALTLALGDLSYGAVGAEEAWCDLVTSRVGPGYPFQLIAGNHESNGQNGNINDFSACLPNQLPGAIGTYGRQYYVDVPAGAPLVRYVMISPGIDFGAGPWSYATGTARHAWTAAAIDGARSAGVPWVVVGMHKPCLSAGEYGCDPGADIMNLLVQKRVDLVLSGHEHHYARTSQLASGPGCPALVPGAFEPSCVVDTDDTLTQGAGTVFATIGTGGVGLRDIHADDPELGYFTAASGANQDPAHGFLQVIATADRLDASFRAVTPTTFAEAFTISRGNLPPTASFTSTTNGMTVSLDGSGSTDPGGSVVSHEWTFGDGQSGSGATVAHTYAAPGDYQVVLTVRDDGGATDSLARTVTIADPNGGPEPFAVDAFGRSVTSGWGSADLGGAWSLASASANFTVANGVGAIRMPTAGSSPGAHLNGVSSSDTEVRVQVSLDEMPTGGGTFVRVQPRRLANGDGYFADARFASNGSITVRLVRLVGTQTRLSSVTAPGLVNQADDTFHIRTQATGTSPTTLRVKIWEAGTAEPPDWTTTATDSTSALQTVGGIGLRAVLDGSAGNAPALVFFDDLWAGPTS